MRVCPRALRGFEIATDLSGFPLTHPLLDGWKECTVRYFSCECEWNWVLLVDIDEVRALPE